MVLKISLIIKKPAAPLRSRREEVPRPASAASAAGSAVADEIPPSPTRGWWTSAPSAPCEVQPMLAGAEPYIPLADIQRVNLLSFENIETTLQLLFFNYLPSIKQSLGSLSKIYIEAQNERTRKSVQPVYMPIQTCLDALNKNLSDLETAYKRILPILTAQDSSHLYKLIKYNLRRSGRGMPRVTASTELALSQGLESAQTARNTAFQRTDLELEQYAIQAQRSKLSLQEQWQQFQEIIYDAQRKTLLLFELNSKLAGMTQEVSRSVEPFLEREGQLLHSAFAYRDRRELITGLQHTLFVIENEIVKPFNDICEVFERQRPHARGATSDPFYRRLDDVRFLFAEKLAILQRTQAHLVSPDLSPEEDLIPIIEAHQNSMEIILANVRAVSKELLVKTYDDATRALEIRSAQISSLDASEASTASSMSIQWTTALQVLRENAKKFYDTLAEQHETREQRLLETNQTQYGYKLFADLQVFLDTAIKFTAQDSAIIDVSHEYKWWTWSKYMLPEELVTYLMPLPSLVLNLATQFDNLIKTLWTEGTPLKMATQPTLAQATFIRSAQRLQPLYKEFSTYIQTSSFGSLFFQNETDRAARFQKFILAEPQEDYRNLAGKLEIMITEQNYVPSELLLLSLAYFNFQHNDSRAVVKLFSVDQTQSVRDITEQLKRQISVAEIRQPRCLIQIILIVDKLHYIGGCIRNVVADDAPTGLQFVWINSAISEVVTEIVSSALLNFCAEYGIGYTPAVRERQFGANCAFMTLEAVAYLSKVYNANSAALQAYLRNINPPDTTTQASIEERGNAIFRFMRTSYFGLRRRWAEFAWVAIQDPDFMSTEIGRSFAASISSLDFAPDIRLLVQRTDYRINCEEIFAPSTRTRMARVIANVNQLLVSDLKREPLRDAVAGGAGGAVVAGAGAAGAGAMVAGAGAGVMAVGAGGGSRRMSLQCQHAGTPGCFAGCSCPCPRCVRR